MVLDQVLQRLRTLEGLLSEEVVEAEEDLNH
jgi:hypothetical protein